MNRACRTLARLSTCALLACGRLGYGPDEKLPDANPNLPPPSAVTNVVRAGESHACAVHGGALSCWGDNTNGDLGNGATTQEDAPVAVTSSQSWAVLGSGAAHTCGIDDMGQVWCWGQNDRGQLATGDTTYHSSPVLSVAQRDWQTLASGSAHVCAVAGDGTLWCWGENFEGELGQNDPNPGSSQGPPQPNPLQVGTASDWTAVAAGDGATCGLRGAGTLWCWGRNSSAELGLGPTAMMQYRSPQQVGADADWVRITIGSWTSCGIRRSNGQSTLWCWGDNTDGSVGVDACTTSVTTPVQITSDIDWVDVQNHSFHTCGLHASGTITCWGRNEEGQLGIGRFDYPQPDLPTQVGTGVWAGVAVGLFFTCAWNRNGDVFCTGDATSGELGLGSAQTNNVNVLTQLSFP